jgi:hypothetical protein
MVSYFLEKRRSLADKPITGCDDQGPPAFSNRQVLQGQTWGEQCAKRQGGSGVTLAAVGVKMSVTIISRRVRASTVTIKLVDGSVVQGKINLHRGDVDIERVSDLFTKVTDPFIVVFDATAEGKSGRVLILNKRNVVWISPGDEPRQKDKPPRQEDEKAKEPTGGSLLDRLRST